MYVYILYIFVINIRCIIIINWLNQRYIIIYALIINQKGKIIYQKN